VTRRYLRAMAPYLRQVAGLLILGSLGGVVMNTVVVLPSILLGRTIDAARAWGAGQATGSDVLRAGLIYAAGVALYQAARIVKRWGLRIGNQRIQASVRADALRGILAWPMERLHQVPIGDLMSRIVGDVQVLGRGLSELTTEAWDTVLFSVSLIVGMLAYDPGLTLLALIPVPLGMALAKATGRWVSARTRAAREANAALTAYLQERLTGLRVVRLFGWIEATVESARDLAGRLAQANLAVIRLRAGLRPVYTLLMMGGIVFVLWMGGERVARGAMTLGAFIAYLDLYSRFVGRGHRVPQLFNSVQSGAAAYERLAPLLAPPQETRPSWLSTLIDAPPAPRRRGRTGPVGVTLRDVSFAYPGNADAVLNDVSLDIAPGMLVAVTGPVGSGKSALARALTGLYPLQAGEIAIDGLPPDRLSSEERASRLGYLPQNGYLFSGSVRENIALAGEVDGDMEALIRVAALEEDVRAFPAGLASQIGERGIRVSGGQRQRIALARAAAAWPGLLILDDPFSAVDVDTEARIVAALREALGPQAPPDRRATIVFTSHRLAAFPLADCVVVLDGGRVVEQGTHEELVAKNGLYARIYAAQQRVGSRGRDA